MDIEVDIDGEELVTSCPLCESVDMQVTVFWQTIKQSGILKKGCPICKGTGSVDVIASGTVVHTIDEPVRNEGYD